MATAIQTKCWKVRAVPAFPPVPGIPGRVSPSEKKNSAASARDRLLALARERGEDFQLLLTRYGLERILYRLSHSPHLDRFVLNA
jgi:hypothetical protein